MKINQGYREKNHWDQNTREITGNKNKSTRNPEKIGNGIMLIFRYNFPVV